MASRPERSTQPRVPLSRDRVLRAAINIADGAGLDALSMRKLAQELGVEAMSVYYYVANKDEILDGIDAGRAIRKWSDPQHRHR